MPINSTVKNLFSKSRLLETGYPTVTLNESELYSVFLIICSDLNWNISKLGLQKLCSRFFQVVREISYRMDGTL